jgi:hypothetical protein
LPLSTEQKEKQGLEQGSLVWQDHWHDIVQKLRRKGFDTRVEKSASNVIITESCDLSILLCYSIEPLDRGLRHGRIPDGIK